MDPMNEIETALRNAAERLPQTAPADSLVERAAADGLLDVAYATVDSPLGPLVVASTPRGLARVAYTLSETRDDVLEDIARRLSPRMLEAPGRLDDTRRELDEYFEGERTEFDLPIDWALTRGFTTRVLRATAEVGFGHTTTYAEMATRAGSPRAVRAAGNSLGSNPMPIVVPCHRVLRTGGALGGYTGGLERKEFLLRLEGTIV
jgi:methylated-DNA-[protein]-cysteine S-methyltransferase